MVVCFLTVTRFFGVLSILFLCLFLNLSCNPTTASIGGSKQFYKYKVTEAKFDLIDSDEFDHTNIFATSDGNGRMLVQYIKKYRSDETVLRQFVKLSQDGGKTFGNEYEVTEVIKSDKEFDSYTFHFAPNGFAVTIGFGKNFLYAQSIGDLENWSEPAQVNDEQDSAFGGHQILHGAENEVFCVWTDTRLGFPLTFFSSSNDGGITWLANQPIDYDFREGNQHYGKIVSGENGRLHAFWQDKRDRKTLFDIRYSFSDDKGENWSESVKINDDEKEVWQLLPTVVAEGSNIYLAFTDFREDGEENDNDWNIYFARSRDNGETWEKNKRLNDIKLGIDGFPYLTIDKEGRLSCVWESGRDTLFGQIVFSYSNDKGETWSPSITVTSKEELVIGEFTILHSISPNKLLLRVGKEESGKQTIYYLNLDKTDELIDSEIEKKNNTGEDNSIIPKKHRSGELLFYDDFSNDTAEKWEPKFGVWNIIGGTYMGVYPQKAMPFVAYAKFQEPEKYILEGRFRMDAVAHTASMLHFRVNENEQKQFVLINHFRIGSWLSLKEFDMPEGTPHIANGQVLAQKRYPFRQDRWYKFKLVVTPEQVDYYVDGSLMLSYKGELDLPNGKIGIGGYTFSPTYFDDISVSEIEK